MTLFAAPRLRKFLRAVAQGSQSLALGLALVAALQLIFSPALLGAKFEMVELFRS